MSVVASAGTSAAAAARSTLQLVLGTAEPDLGPEAWRAVAALALRECCGPLLWHRAGAHVREAAPADVVAKLRGHAIQQTLLHQGRLALLHDLLGRLSGDGVDTLALKGMALSQLLYGTPFARPSADVDLWVPPSQRAQARQALLAKGWRLVEGRAPFEEAFSRREAQEHLRLEVHSYLLGDLLAHLPEPAVGRTAIAVEGGVLPTLSRPFHAVTLATHLAGHRVFPLLFAIDWSTLWSGMSADERDAATRIARGARAERYLAWAQQVAAQVALASTTDAGSDQALRALGFGPTRVASGNPVLRAVRLGRTTADRGAVLGSWLLPPHLPRQPVALARVTTARIGRRLRAIRSPESDATRQLRVHVPGEVPTIPVTDQALADLVTRRGSQGQDALWVRANGESMHPTIPNGALVRLRVATPAAVQRGDVVLARLPDGRVVLHRVVALGPDTMRLRGDGNVGSDPAVPRDAIVAIADAAVLGERSLPVGRRARLNVGVALRRVWASVRRGALPAMQGWRP